MLEKSVLAFFNILPEPEASDCRTTDDKRLKRRANRLSRPHNRFVAGRQKRFDKPPPQSVTP